MPRILLVEDHDGVARGTIRMLTAAGYEIGWEKTVEAALARLQRDRFDLEIWDGSLANSHDGAKMAVARHKEGHNVLLYSGDKAVKDYADAHKTPATNKPSLDLPELVTSLIESRARR